MLKCGANRFRRDQDGGISVLSALILPIVLGTSGLAVEFGHGLLVREQNQRIADLAAYAGALAYKDTKSNKAMIAAAANVAVLNGVPANQVTASLATSPSANGNQAVSVKITAATKLLLAPVLGFGNELPISSVAYAEMPAGAPACIVALSGMGTGITLSGGTSLLAPACGIASNNAVSAPCGTTIKATAVSYNSSSAPSQPCAGIQNATGGPTKITRAVTSDPIANSSVVSDAVGRLSTVRAMTAPTAPTAPSVPTGVNIDFAYQASATQNQAIQAGCTASFASPVWTLTCPPAVTYNFGTITMGGGISVRFNTGGSTSAVYNFSGPITNTGTMTFGPGTYNLSGFFTNSSTVTFGSGTYNFGGPVTNKGTMTFGPGTFKIGKGLYTEGSSSTTFGAGTFQIGQGASGCGGSAKYSICHQGDALTFGGPSQFRLTSGFFVRGGATLTLGSGSSNSFEIGASSSGDAMTLSGGSKVFLGDATASGSLFRIAGNINVSSGGGSCLTLSAAAHHDILGNLSTAGGTILGAGIYTVTGYVGLGTNGGGDVNCNGTTVGLKANDVTFVLGGYPTPVSGTCAGQAYCVAAGYSTVSMTAPSSGVTAQFLVIGPQTAGTTAGAKFAQGANTSLSGVFYFPNGPIALSGGASVGNGPGQCLQIIGSQITLSGGTTAGSNCAGVGTSSGSGRVVLVQ